MSHSCFSISHICKNNVHANQQVTEILSEEGGVLGQSFKHFDLTGPLKYTELFSLITLVFTVSFHGLVLICKVLLTHVNMIFLSFEPNTFLQYIAFLLIFTSKYTIGPSQD